jgi:hypothetical protein
MNGREAIAVFSKRELAENFLNTINIECQIDEYTVRGKEPSNPKTVYAGHEYKRNDDIHYFLGLYWNYDDANKESGEDSLIKDLGIDIR